MGEDCGRGNEQLDAIQALCLCAPRRSRTVARGKTTHLPHLGLTQCESKILIDDMQIYLLIVENKFSVSIIVL